MVYKLSRILKKFSYLTALILWVGFVGVSCNNKPAKQHQAVTLEPLNKQALLNLLKELAVSMSAKEQADIKTQAILSRYQRRYKINLPGNDRPYVKSKDYTDVYINTPRTSTSTPSVPYILTLIPVESIRSQITFHDLISRFGQWNVGLLPKETALIISDFHLKEAPGVSLLVSSKAIPTISENSIEKFDLLSL